MNDELDILKNTLAKEGWNFGPSFKDTGVSWNAWKRLEGAVDCIGNNNPPSLALIPYEINLNGKVFHSVEFELTGQSRSGRWLNFKTYSVQVNEAMEAIPECRAILLAAWNAANTIESRSNADYQT